MDDGVDAVQGRAECRRVHDVAGPQLHAGGEAGREAASERRAGVGRTDERNDTMARDGQLGDDVAADEAGGAGDKDGGHGSVHPSGGSGAAVARRAQW